MWIRVTITMPQANTPGNTTLITIPCSMRERAWSQPAVSAQVMPAAEAPTARGMPRR